MSIINGKVTAIGFKSAGKTTYLAGAYNIMSVGLGKYTLLASRDDDDMYLQTIWENICYGKGRNWPVPNDETRKFTFSLCHSMEAIGDFEWLDYPGAAMVDPNYGLIDEIKCQIQESSCLFLLINGESFAFVNNKDRIRINANSADEYSSQVKRNLIRNHDLDAIRRLSAVATQGIALPPIVLVITKSDLIEDKWIPYLGDILSESFNSVFGHDAEDTHLVMITAVTLGAGIEEGEDADPENIEQPIAFAFLSMLCKELVKTRLARQASLGRLNRSDTFFRRLVKPGEIESIQGNIRDHDKKIKEISRDAINLLKLFDDGKNMYVNGRKENLKNYFMSIIQEQENT